MSASEGLRPGRRTLSREATRAGRFAAVGVAATLVHAAVYLALVSSGTATPALANGLGFAVAFLVSLSGQYGWTFADRTRALTGKHRHVAALRFAGVSGAGFAMNAGFVALTEAVGADPRLAVLFIVAVTPVATFLLAKYWAFADRTERPAAPAYGEWTTAAWGWLVPLLAIAAVVPLLANSVTFGVPQELDPDEMIFMGAALRMLSQASLDPGWYGAPAQLLIYALSAAYAAYIVVLDQLGVINGLSDAARYYFEDRTPFIVIGRIFSVLSATGCLLVVVAILREIRAGLVAILFAIATVALSPLILGFSSIIRMDFQQILFNLLTSLFCLRAMIRGAENRHLLLAGACVGAAITSKFTGIAGAATVLATVTWLVAKRRLVPLRGLGLLVAAGLASVAAAFVTGPYLFLSFGEMLAAVANEARPSHLGATSTGFLAALGYYTTTAMPMALGWGGCLLAAAGMVLSVRQPLGVVTIPFVVMYLVFVSTLNLYWYRWLLPVVPYAALFVAVAVGAALARFGSGQRLRAVPVIAISALLLAPTARDGLALARFRAFDLDTRVAALTWIEENLPKGTRVLLETDAPGISSRDYAAFIVQPDGIVLWTSIEEHVRVTGYYTYFGMWEGTPDALIANIRRENIDYVVMSDWDDRFRHEAAAYPHEVAVYSAFRTAFPIIREFTRPPGWGGPTIRVLAARPP